MYAIYDTDGGIVGVVTDDGARYSTVLDVLENEGFIIKNIHVLETLSNIN